VKEKDAPAQEPKRIGIPCEIKRATSAVHFSKPEAIRINSDESGLIGFYFSAVLPQPAQAASSRGAR
jgi:hypothetical protein